MSKFEQSSPSISWYTPPQQSNQSIKMSSALSFTFRPSLIPEAYQAEFLTRFCQMVLDYETLTTVSQSSPPAESLPEPSSFTPVEGDGADGEVPASLLAAKKPRKNPWADLTEEQRADRLAAMRRGRAAKAAERRLSEDSLNVAPAVAAKTLDEMTANELYERLGALMSLPADAPLFRRHDKFPNKQALVTEIRRLEAATVAPTVAATLPVPAPVPVAVAVAVADAAPVEDAASETSSKKARKNPWATLTPEQKEAKIAAMKAGRDAKKAAAAAAVNIGSA